MLHIFPPTRKGSRLRQFKGKRDTDAFNVSQLSNTNYSGGSVAKNTGFSAPRSALWVTYFGSFSHQAVPQAIRDKIFQVTAGNSVEHFQLVGTISAILRHIMHEALSVLSLTKDF